VVFRVESSGGNQITASAPGEKNVMVGGSHLPKGHREERGMWKEEQDNLERATKKQGGRKEKSTCWRGLGVVKARFEGGKGRCRPRSRSA